MPKIKILTKEQRHEAGKALREKCPRKSHRDVVLGQGERDIVKLIEASNKDRLENLVPVRHGRMVQSVFAYFRGTALIQAHDLKGTPSSGIIVHSCGDCHLMNFGGFATPERNIVFDINDFDETLVSPQRHLKIDCGAADRRTLACPEGRAAGSRNRRAVIIADRKFEQSQEPA